MSHGLGLPTTGREPLHCNESGRGGNAVATRKDG